MTSNVEAIYREYPFLESIIPKEGPIRATVERADKRLFEVTPYQYDNEGDPFIVRHIFDLLDEKGVRIARVGEPLTPQRWFNPLSWFQDRRHESLRETILRIGDRASRVAYIVTKWKRESAFTLYRMPKASPNAKAWFDAELAEARNELRQE